MTTIVRALLVFGLVMIMLGGCSQNGARQISVNGSDSRVGSVNDISVDVNHHDDGDEDSDERPSDQDADNCASRLGTDVQHLVLRGNNDNFDVTTDQAVAIKIVSNRPNVNVTINAANPTIHGVCVFVRGNKANVTIDVKGSVDTIYYVADGNKSQGRIHVHAPAKVGAIKIDVDGNKSSLSIDGDGQFSCPSGEIDGNKSALVCSNN